MGSESSRFDNAVARVPTPSSPSSAMAYRSRSASNCLLFSGPSPLAIVHAIRTISFVVGPSESVPSKSSWYLLQQS
jgi:hypothetical protein